MILAKHPLIFANIKQKFIDSTWLSHTPFLFFVSSAVKPSVFVELGMDDGQAYYAVCQAVKMLKISTRCYGIASQYENKIKKYDNKEYSSFSSILHNVSAETFDQYENSSIDLMIINNCKTYEEVKNNFETWLPKMSDKGVVIFNNTFIKDSEFSVWKFWEAVSSLYPGFEFYHNNGIGLVATGERIKEELSEFLHDEENFGFYRKFFANLGYQSRLSALNEGLSSEIFKKEQRMNFYSKLDKLMPEKSIRRKVVSKSIDGMINSRNAFSKFFRRSEVFNTDIDRQNILYLETLKSIEKLPVPMDEVDKRKCAIFVMVKDENLFLPIWLKYYSKFFSGEDIYVFDHRTTDDSIIKCQEQYKFNVIPLSYPYSFDHEWFKVVAYNTQKKLLKSYEYVVFTDVDEIIIPDRKKYNGLDDYINKMTDDSIQCLGYDLIHMENDEDDYDPDKSVLSQRKYWYHTFWYNKTLISKRPLDWEIGFHEVRDNQTSIDRDLLLVHLHKLDFKKCWNKSFERARLRWLPSEIKANRGWQNRIIDIDDFRDYYYGWPDGMMITEIPEELRRKDEF